MPPDYSTKNPLLKPLTNSLECSKAFRKIWEKGSLRHYECVYVIFLNRHREHVFHEMLNKGNYSETNFNLRRVIHIALHKSACNIIIAHNHTSGIAKPSKLDVDLTKILSNLCLTLEINLVDHIIITADDYYSFRDHGLIK